jgi:hypothetical protein
MIGDDLAPFFVPGEFAGTDDTLDGNPVAGIFDGAYVRTGGGIGMSSTHPVYTLPEAFVPTDVQDMTLYVSAERSHFRVVDQEPAGSGVVVLILEKT